MLSTLKTTDVRSRIEPHLKDRATEVLAECGLKLSDAIRLFLRQVVAERGLPFEVRSPNATTKAAMKQSRAIRKSEKGTEGIKNDQFYDLVKKKSLRPLFVCGFVCVR